jgi:SAM-dependent methyltransferase
MRGTLQIPVDAAASRRAGELSPGAAVQGELWGSRARDWAAFNEPAWRPIFETVIGLAGAAPGRRFLDIGCGAGGALMVARQRGADVAGVDASTELVAIARERLPGATIEVGDMEDLPFPDETFDIVTGINSFQFAQSLTNALAEAKRVLRRDGTLVLLVWGRRDECELVNGTASAVFALLPTNRPGTSPVRSLDQPGVMEEAMRDAGLQVTGAGEFSAALAVPNADAAVRAVLSASARAIRHVGEATVAGAIRATLPKFTQPNGSIVWKNQFRWATGIRV